MLCLWLSLFHFPFLWKQSRFAVWCNFKFGFYQNIVISSKSGAVLFLFLPFSRLQLLYELAYSCFVPKLKIKFHCSSKLDYFCLTCKLTFKIHRPILARKIGAKRSLNVTIKWTFGSTLLDVLHLTEKPTPEKKAST